MVVDDDRNICFTVETIGAYAGWTVHSCLEVQSALMAMPAYCPDVVILDYHLPFMNGLAALPLIRKTNRTVPIIMLTVEDDSNLAEKCREAGANDFSLKPIKALDLIHRVNLNVEVAKLRRNPRTMAEEQLDKGLNQETVDLLLAFSKNRREYFTINEASAALKLGYSTTHRYLNYLEDQGYLIVQHGYGKQGRPRKKYRVARVDKE